MKDLIRDSTFGQLVRLVTRNKVFLYPEEKDSEVWKKYVNKEKSANMATYGQTSIPEDEDEKDNNEQPARNNSPSRSQSSSSTAIDESSNVNEVSGKPIDQEKGKDSHVVDWYGADDPEVRATLLR